MLVERDHAARGGRELLTGAVNRLIALRSAQIDYADFVRGVGNVLEQGNPDEALALCDETPAPVARIVAAAVSHVSETSRVGLNVTPDAGLNVGSSTTSTPKYS